MIFVILAVLGGLLVSVGVGLLSIPMGVIVAGLELLAAAYAGAYMRAKR